MSLEDRIARLEQRIQSRLHPVDERNFPVLVISWDDDESDDLEEPYCIEHQGQCWVQLPDETFDQFQDRATDEAVRLCTPPRRGEVLILSPMRGRTLDTTAPAIEPK